ncbi:MAG TPA: hypothetical protein PKO30_12280 [Prolixibacteraceae bacterium]|nr:hypothetical protein [Prolixibacteraceae bacterium]
MVKIAYYVLPGLGNSESQKDYWGREKGLVEMLSVLLKKQITDTLLKGVITNIHKQVFFIEKKINSPSGFA